MKYFIIACTLIVVCITCPIQAHITNSLDTQDISASILAEQENQLKLIKQQINKAKQELSKLKRQTISFKREKPVHIMPPVWWRYEPGGWYQESSITCVTSMLPFTRENLN
jgi:hypothetical protein